MRFILLISVLFFNTLLFAQNDEARVDSLIVDFTAKLNNRGIDTYAVSKRYCLGEINIFKLGNEKICTSKSTYFSVYIFWQENDKNMIKKIDNCGLYLSLQLPDNRVLDFMDRNKEDINMHPIKPYEIESKLGGPIRSTETYPCSRVLRYVSPELSFDQTFALFDLTNDALEDNINYEYNNNLLALDFEKLLTLVISNIDNEFRRH